MYEQPPALPTVAARASVEERAAFLAKTYRTLFGAVVAFVAVEYFLFASGIADAITAFALNTNWLLFLGGFIVVASVARRFTFAASQATQWAAMAGYIVAEAVIFAPLLWIANEYADGVISSAAAVTLAGFAVLTAIVFATRRDFSFMRGALLWIGFGALGLIVASVLFGFQLGNLFSIAMIVFAGASILYDTSKVLHHYPTDRHVGAALDLFASAALMFWYVLRLFLGSRR